MVTTRAFALRDAGERHACQMLFEGGRFRCRPPFLFCTQKDLHDLLNLSFRAGLLCSCASRSRTYDGGVKVPCLTAWRWRTGKNQYSRISFICQAKAFCRVCAKCFATLLPCLYSVLVIMRTACPFSALFSQKVLTPPL